MATNVLRAERPERIRTRSRITAGPVEARVFAPTGNADADAILQGLSLFSQSLEQDFRVQRAEDLAAGQAAAKAGMSEEEARTKSRSFLEAYLHGTGQAAAIQDAKELEAKVLTEWDGTSPIDQFISDFYNEKTKGLTDNDYKRGYDSVMSEQAQALRAKIAEGQAAEVITANVAQANARISYAIDRAIATGQPLDSSVMDQINAIASESRIAHMMKDEMIFLALKEHSDKGHPEVWEFTKIPRTDPVTGKPVPSIYDNPKWTEKIDNEIKAAEDRAYQLDLRKREMERRERQDRQEEALMPAVRAIIAGDHELGLRLAREVLMDQTLFTRADETGAAFQRLVSMRDTARTVDEEVRHSNYLRSIYRGEVSLEDILNIPDLSPTTLKSLLAAYDRHQTELRQQAAAQSTSTAALQQARRAAFSDPIYTRAVERLRLMLRPHDNVFDLDRETYKLEQAELADALTRLDYWRLANLDATEQDILIKVNEIIDDILAQRQARVVPEKEYIRFHTVEELEAAYAAGKITPPEYAAEARRIRDRMERQQRIGN